MPNEEIKPTRPKERECERCGGELHALERHTTLDACFASLIERLRESGAPLFRKEEEAEKPAETPAKK